MEKKSLWPVFRAFLFLGQLFLQTLCTTIVWRLNMLPDKYIILLLGAMVMFAVCTGVLIFVNVPKKLALWRKIISTVLALLIMLGCGAIFKIALDAHKLMQNVTTQAADARNTYVVVLNDNAAQTVKDTKGYRFAALVDYDVEHTQQMLTYIESQTEETVALTSYNQSTQMVQALYDREVDALIMNGASISLLIEQPEFEDFLSRARLLYELPFEAEQPKVEKPKEPAGDAFVVYISGSDTRSNLLRVSRSDVNILAVANPKTKQVLLVNTPRDFYVPNPAGKGALDKLTHCGNYGVECSVEALAGFYETEIAYYGQINFVGFEKLIDAIDGITVVADHSFTAITGDYFQKGENTINGEKALAFARERYNVSGGDRGRGNNQMKVITAVINKMTSSSTLIANYADILASLEGMFVTNFTPDEISKLIKSQMEDMSPWNVQSYAVTGKGGYAETYSWKGQELYVMYPDEATVNHAKTLISRVMKGESLTAEDMALPQ